MATIFKWDGNSKKPQVMSYDTELGVIKPLFHKSILYSQVFVFTKSCYQIAVDEEHWSGAAVSGQILYAIWYRIEYAGWFCYASSIISPDFCFNRNFSKSLGKVFHCLKFQTSSYFSIVSWHITSPPTQNMSLKIFITTCSTNPAFGGFKFP